MHFKNGRAAKSGDPVIGKNWNGEVFAGHIVDLNPSTSSCNVTVTRAFGPDLQCMSVGSMYHAEDGFNALETPPAFTPPPPPAFVPPPPPSTDQVSPLPQAAEQADADPAQVASN
ncbi:MAG TPA: hypothetical protein VFB72_19400 [Verrucomicrobiae bacterium]|nr:hypothetical protein [Verrucomicrobiae bacterium]